MFEALKLRRFSNDSTITDTTLSDVKNVRLGESKVVKLLNELIIYVFTDA